MVSRHFHYSDFIYSVTFYLHIFCDCSLNRKTDQFSNFFFLSPISLHAVCSVYVNIMLLQDRGYHRCKVNICLCVYPSGSSVLEELFGRTTKYCKWPFCRTCPFRENPEKSDLLSPELFSHD